MSESRPALPEDLEATPPGPRLSGLLATVKRADLDDRDRLRLAKARNRQVSYEGRHHPPRPRKVTERRVGAFLDHNNLASLSGYELAPHRVAAAWERLTAIARAAKAEGDQRRIDQLRADAFLDLLGLLRRFHHLFKHATGSELLQPSPGVFLWKPHATSST